MMDEYDLSGSGFSKLKQYLILFLLMYLVIFSKPQSGDQERRCPGLISNLVLLDYESKALPLC
jgi:hypothetical protein